MTKQTWTREECRAEAAKYNTRNLFRLNCNGGYQAASSHPGWLDDICSHMGLGSSRPAQVMTASENSQALAASRSETQNLLFSMGRSVS